MTRMTRMYLTAGRQLRLPSGALVELVARSTLGGEVYWSCVYRDRLGELELSATWLRKHATIV